MEENPVTETKKGHYYITAPGIFTLKTSIVFTKHSQHFKYSVMNFNNLGLSA